MHRSRRFSTSSLRTRRLLLAVLAAGLSALAVAPSAFALAESEPNNVINQANGPLVAGEANTGTINQIDFGDIDYFYFAVSSPTTVQIDFTNTTTCNQTGRVRCLEHAVLVDSHNALMSCNAGQSPDCNSTLPVSVVGDADGTQAGETETLKFPLPAAGTYAIRVEGADANFTYSFVVNGALTASTGGGTTPPPPPPPPPPPGPTCTDLAKTLKTSRAALTKDHRTRATHAAQLAKDQAALKKARTGSERTRLNKAVTADKKKLAADKKKIEADKKKIETDLKALTDARCTCDLLADELSGLKNQLIIAKKKLAADKKALKKAKKARDIERLQAAIVIDNQKIKVAQDKIADRKSQQQANSCPGTTPAPTTSGSAST
jgi:hypothetical protein